MSAFEALLYERLIPEFCADETRRLAPTGFRQSSMTIGQEDARYFMMAWDAGLIIHQGRGQYRACVSKAKEQFFWEGPRESESRWFTLWKEPVITVAGLARLHFDYGWPAPLIGTQSSGWAFDLVAHKAGADREYIAGEVKKTKGEIDQLIVLMTEYGSQPRVDAPSSAQARNAWKKVEALRSSKAPVFWALGPSGYSRAFAVCYYADGGVRFSVTEASELHYDA